MKSGSAAKSTSMIQVVAVDKDSAVGDVGVVVKNDSVMMPVISPVMPAPPEAAKESHSKAKAERDSRSCKEQSRIRIPARPDADGLPIDEPGIILRHVNNLRVRRLDHNGLALLANVFLRCALQVPRLVRPRTHYLNSIHHVLLLVHISIAKR